MICPYCGFNQNNVLESRDAEDGRATRRRRVCEKCGKRFTTYERVGSIDLRVVKKDGRNEDFDHKKLARGITKACWKRPVDQDQINEVVEEIEMKLLNRKKIKIPSKDIGIMVMNRLKKLDEIAYLRFASVYLDIQKLEDFEKILADAKSGKNLRSVKI